MPVDPFLEQMLAGLTELPDKIDDFDAFREEQDRMNEQVVLNLAESGPEVKERREVTIPVERGFIDLHVYVPPGQGPWPGHIYLHGGGWIGGTIKSTATEITARERCIGADCVVVTVNYRKAPEHKFPIPVNDCLAALIWVHEHSPELGIRPNCLTIGGASAGANLAAAVTLLARDHGGPRCAFQLLEVPALDLTASLAASHQTCATGYGLTAADVRKCIGYYLASDEDTRNPYASPLLAEDLSGLPPAYLMSSEYDPVRDDGPLYAARLNEAGVPATCSLKLGHIHVSGALTKVMPAARDWREEVLNTLARVNQSLVAAENGASGETA